MNSLLLLLSNSLAATPEALTASAFVLTNDAAKTAPEWIEIPFGQHDHKSAMQILDEPSAKEIVANFEAEKKDKGRRFKGLPIYLGHPDDPQMSGPNPDKRARGWIREAAVSNEALRLKTDWNALGRGEVEGEEVAYFSPRWGVRRIANTTRNVRPVHLVSVGLTNEPNIGVLPLTNERTTAMKFTLTPDQFTKLQLAATATPEEIETRLLAFLSNAQEPPADDKPAPLPPWIHELAGTDPATADDAAVKDALTKQRDSHQAITAVKEARDKVQKSHEKLDRAHQELQQKMSNETARAEGAEAEVKKLKEAPLFLVNVDAAGKTQLTLINEADQKLVTDLLSTVANERQVCAAIVVEKAVREGRLRLTEAETRITALSNAGDQFASQVQALVNAAVIVPVHAALQTANLGRRKESADDLQGQVLTLVNERQVKHGQTYDEAWAHVRKHYPGLLDQMKQPAKA